MRVCDWQEVRLARQPTDGHHGCTYYMTLLQSSQRQLHLGDFVYIAPSDLLLPPGDSWMKHIDELAIYSVERLWIDARSVSLRSLLIIHSLVSESLM